ncbi:MAG: hypothetical protein DHS20C05_11790 [Hyphococcus sp.]|nr:MAG: hypothetical protein DHS20C05_11790 [Marinicaulis sp.]
MRGGVHQRCVLFDRFPGRFSDFPFVQTSKIKRPRYQACSEQENHPNQDVWLRHKKSRSGAIMTDRD